MTPTAEERIEVQLATLVERMHSHNSHLEGVILRLDRVTDELQDIRVWRATMESRAEVQHRLVNDVQALMIWKTLIDPDSTLAYQLKPLFARELIADEAARRGLPPWLKYASAIAAFFAAAIGLSQIHF